MSELSDWKRIVLPGLLADERAAGRGEAADEIASLRAQLAEVEGERDRLREELRALGFEANCYVDAVHANIDTNAGRSLLAALDRARAVLEDQS